MTISLSEDATRMIEKVQYDPNTNQLIGFVLPINSDNGLPIPFQFPARNANEILSRFSNGNAVSSFLNVVVTSYSYSCIEINAHILILIILFLKKKLTNQNYSCRIYMIASHAKKYFVHLDH